MHKLNMCLTWMVVQVISTRKTFTLVCCVLTFFLISKILFTFAITKPTSTFKGEKELEFFDLPEIVVCPDPGVKFDVLEKYGYTTRLRYTKFYRLFFLNKIVFWGGKLWKIWLHHASQVLLWRCWRYWGGFWLEWKQRGSKIISWNPGGVSHFAQWDE